ncbi:MAG TPA: hypothetical protein PK516_07545 [Sedimentibacter sp.]|jgi:hypothetical protein|nr:hypothetical protein [Sedimentibacter sp.]NLA12762.1 hypothetical protein [Tissierellia bacterium]HOA19472.1 hypothetical protein [Sedimentibacter sp.]HOG61947.1 hypothetical protein [Sedimentibacter sp.]HOT21344.1 hypothetical protein [Sedimentibacter sp.]
MADKNIKKENKKKKKKETKQANVSSVSYEQPVMSQPELVPKKKKKDE